MLVPLIKLLPLLISACASNVAPIQSRHAAPSLGLNVGEGAHITNMTVTYTDIPGPGPILEQETRGINKEFPSAADFTISLPPLVRDTITRDSLPILARRSRYTIEMTMEGSISFRCYLYAYHDGIQTADLKFNIWKAKKYWTSMGEGEERLYPVEGHDEAVDMKCQRM